MVSIGIIVSKENMKDLIGDDGLLDIDEYKQRKNAKKQGIKKYRVRVPLIHGIAGDNSSIPDSKLPYATYCPVPGSSYTELNVGDKVYVAVVDFKFDELVILSCVPYSQTNGKSISGLALQRVQYLSMDKDAPLRVGENIKIGSGDTQITFKNLSVLKGFEQPLTEYIWPLKNGGTGVQINSESDTKQVRDNFGIPSTVLISQSKFDKLVDTNTLEKNTIYYIWDDNE